VKNRTPGDATGDGRVNGMDLIRLRKYLAGDNVTIDLSNADVTGDGRVNGMDLIRLRKYLAGDSVVLQ
jgi:Dockerin type I repeat.